jgi:hypothetical protein
VILIENDKEAQFVEKLNQLSSVKDKMSKEGDGYMRQLQTMKKILAKSDQPMSTRSENEIRTIYGKWQEEVKKVESCQIRIGMIQKARTNMTGFVAKVEMLDVQAPLKVIVMGQESSVASGLQRVRVEWKGKQLVQESLEEKWSLTRGEGLPVSEEEGLAEEEEGA